MLGPKRADQLSPVFLSVQQIIGDTPEQEPALMSLLTGALMRSDNVADALKLYVAHQNDPRQGVDDEGDHLTIGNVRLR
ncbi:MAG: hypothetical protein ACYCW6_31585 [Candidatus Xenobia bacterium]